MAVNYREFSKLNLPVIEQEILAKWNENQAFEQSVSLRDGAAPFVFYEGPPSANGMPGIHHVISRTLKDLVCRYKTMRGYQVKRKAGWDTHGLPIELGVEKELGITKEDIGKKISVEEYNRKCREAVMRYKDKWDDLTKKMGYWVDLEQLDNDRVNERINEGLENATHFLLVWSKNARESDWVKEERNAASSQDYKDKLQIFSFKLDNTSLPALIFSNRRYFEINTKNLDTQIENFIRSLDGLELETQVKIFKKTNMS